MKKIKNKCKICGFVCKDFMIANNIKEKTKRHHTANCNGADTSNYVEAINNYMSAYKY